MVRAHVAGPGEVDVELVRALADAVVALLRLHDVVVGEHDVADDAARLADADARRDAGKDRVLEAGHVRLHEVGAVPDLLR